MKYTYELLAALIFTELYLQQPLSSAWVFPDWGGRVAGYIDLS